MTICSTGSWWPLKASQSCCVNSVSSTFCTSCLFVGVLQHNNINLLLFQNVLSGSGVGAPGSRSAVVSVGQELWEAGGMRSRRSPPVVHAPSDETVPDEIIVVMCFVY